MSERISLRGRTWFHALSGVNTPATGDPASILATSAPLGDSTALFLAVVPNPQSRFPCVREGEVGLEEAYALASHLRRVIAEDHHRPRLEKRPIVAIVDVKSQAYGRREETAGIFLAAAAAADAYASARTSGHPVIALIVGSAFSGGFLTHGYQANRILAFDDPEATVHAMRKEAAARITRRSVQELDSLAGQILPMSYDIRGFNRLGLLFRLLQVDQPLAPGTEDIHHVRKALLEAIDDARRGKDDLSIRYQSPAALEARQAGNRARRLMEEQWISPERMAETSKTR